MKQYGPRNALKQSPEEGPKLDPKKVRKNSDFGVNFWGVVFGYFFAFWLSGASLGSTWASLGLFWATLGSCWASLVSSWAFLGSS